MRRTSLVLWLLLLVSLVGAVTLWPRAFPAAAIDFRLTPPEAKARMAAFLKAQGFPLKDYRSAVEFAEDDDTTHYIELEHGIAKLERVTQSGLNVWYWSGRWFKPEQHEEFGAAVDPQGRIVGFSHTIEEAKELPSLDKDAAREMAGQFLRERIPQHPWNTLRFVTDSTEERPHRTDYTFTWERDAFRLGDAPYRLTVTVQGNTVGGYNEYLKVPETWTRGFEKKRTTNTLCMSIAMAALTVLGIGFLVILVQSIRARRLRWKNALPWGWLVFFAAVEILAKVNGVPGVFSAYETTEKWLPYLGTSFFDGLRDVLLSVGLLWLLVLVADALYREKFPHLLPFQKSLGPGGFRDERTVRSLAIGCVFALVSVAYVSAFYIVGRRWGIWTPVEIESSKTLGGWLPWAAPIQTGVSAAFLEEMLFRVIGIAIFWKLVRVRWLAILLAAATWAFLHSSYPQMPGYARGIELTVVGVVWSVLMFRYGVLTTLTAHYLYDCWLGEMVVFQSASWVDRAGAFAGSAWPVVFLAAAWCLRRRAENRVAAIPAESESHVPAPEAPREGSPAAPLLWSWKKKASLAAASGALLAAGFLLPLPQDPVQALGKLHRHRREIAAAADLTLREHGFDPARYHRVLTCSRGSTASAYLLENGTFGRLAKLYQTELPAVRWSARYFRVLEKEEFRIDLDRHGRLIQWNHIVPREAAGASLPAADALALAQKTLTEQYGVDLSHEKLVSNTPEKQERRLDYAFELERTGWHWGDAQLRTVLRLRGDEPVAFERYVKVPEAWLLERRKSGWKEFLTNELESWLSLAEGVLAVVVFCLLVAKRLVPWKRAFLLAIFPAAVSLGLTLDRLPWLYVSYKTTTPLAHFLTMHWLTTALGVAVGYLGYVVLIGVTLGLARWAFGWEWKHWVVWPRERSQRAQFWTTTFVSVLTGYALICANAAFGQLLRGTFLPGECGSFSLPFVNASAPWLRSLLSSLNGGISGVAVLASAWAAAALLYRRFPRLTVCVILLFPLLHAIQQSSWPAFFCALATGEMTNAVNFVLVCRLFRFNVTAFALTCLLTPVAGSILTFANQGGEGYRWQALWLALAVALPLFVGWMAHRRDAQSHPAPGRPLPEAANREIPVG